MSRMDAGGVKSRLLRLSGRWRIAVAAVLVVVACIAIRSLRGPEAASARDAASARGAVQQTSATAPAGQKPQIVAMVNNEQIGRQELADECLTHYGKEVLDAMINKFLIVQFCQQQNVTVSKDEVNQEIERMAKKFGVPLDQWLKMLEQERGITQDQYANDIVWPMLALKKLAADRLKPTQQELQDAFEMQYGEAIRARIIVMNDRQKAAKVAAEAKQNPEQFGNLAVQNSLDASASASGMIPPIKHHVGDPTIERTVFRLQAGEVSDVIQIGDQYVILKCDARVPAAANVRLEQVRDKLIEALRDRKLHSAAADVFQQLHKQSTIVIVYTDPVKSRQMPGVAAIVNDRKVTIRELAEECIDKHGKEALEGTINRRLLEQAVRAKRLTISDDDLNAEVARAAAAAGKVDKQKRPDIAGWVKMVTEEQGVTAEMYYQDAVWPSVALKKIVGDVKVTQEDMQRGFTANYGPRVQCRVIMLTSERKAQEVWELARTELQKPKHDPEFFGKLAEQYSVDPSRAVQGRVPPIQRYGGMTQLEDQAFQLKAGEMSGIIALGDKFVILYCEGRTQPIKVEMADVEQALYDDIQEKKSRLAMADAFNRIRENAQIDNYLTGTSQSPKRRGADGHGEKGTSAAVTTNPSLPGEYRK